MTFAVLIVALIAFKARQQVRHAQREATLAGRPFNAVFR